MHLMWGGEEKRGIRLVFLASTTSWVVFMMGTIADLGWNSGHFDASKFRCL